MIRNLVAEMARNSITKKDIAQLLGITEKSVTNKIEEKQDFKWKEVIKIHDRFFPKMKVEELFEGEIPRRRKGDRLA